MDLCIWPAPPAATGQTEIPYAAVPLTCLIQFTFGLTGAKGKNRARPKEVLEHLGGRGGCTGRELNRMTNEERRANQEWKKDTRYGLRWMVEIIISAFKRVFGESVRALTPRTAFIEVATRVAAYNRNLDIGDEAILEETNRRAQAYGAVTA